MDRAFIIKQEAIGTMSKKKILEDHKRSGKVFVPPFIHKLGPLSETSWIKSMLPELLWLALVQEYYGDAKGVALITSMTRLTRNCVHSDELQLFATISSFKNLKPDEQSCIHVELANTAELFELQKALLPLIMLYPECPLRFLYSTKPTPELLEHNIERIKKIVQGLFDKTTKFAMMVQATGIWIAFDSGILKVAEGLALASFPEIEKYPETELSRKVASSIRASVFMLFHQPHYPADAEWPSYFWNHGLQIDKCYFPDEEIQ